MKRTNEEVFIKAYSDHEQSLLKRSFFKISDKDIADDLVQTTFLKTWQYIIKSGKIDSMRAFLFHILNNLIIDEYRKQKPVSLEIMTEGGFQIVVDDSERLFNMIDGKTAVMLIPLLTDKYREVVAMHYIEEMTLAEIAAATKQSRNTVAVQIHRGVDKLAILFRVEPHEAVANR